MSLLDEFLCLEVSSQVQYLPCGKTQQTAHTEYAEEQYTTICRFCGRNWEEKNGLNSFAWDNWLIRITICAAHFFFAFTCGSKVLYDSIWQIFQTFQVHFQWFQFAGFSNLWKTQKYYSQFLQSQEHPINHRLNWQIGTRFLAKRIFSEELWGGHTKECLRIFLFWIWIGILNELAVRIVYAWLKSTNQIKGHTRYTCEETRIYHVSKITGLISRFIFQLKCRNKNWFCFL